jgi:DNA-binding transcriptional ArsR family regulator
MADDEAGRTRSQIRLDARNLRGIAHPARVRILNVLRMEGPATATTLARRLGMNTGATSYHLRQLAAHAFVMEETTRGSARERWWRAAHWGTRLDLRTLPPDQEELGLYLRSIVELYADTMARAVDEMPAAPEPWRRSVSFNDYLLRLTPDELRRLREEVVAVVARYRTADPDAPDRAQAPADAVDVMVQFQAFPRPGSLTTAPDDPPGGGTGGADGGR